MHENIDFPLIPFRKNKSFTAHEFMLVFLFQFCYILP